MKRRSFQVPPSHPGISLEAALVQELQFSETAARALVERGAVYVDGRRCRMPQVPLRPGQTVLAVLEESGQSVLTARSPAPLHVIYEDADVLAVNKAAGVLSQPGPAGGNDSLWDLTSAYLGQGIGQAGLVHRLDKDTSGVMVFGKTPEATSALAAAFREGAAQKTYVAVTRAQCPTSGFIDFPLAKDPKRPGRYVALRDPSHTHGVSAQTRYEWMVGQGEWAAVQLTPLTGRTHQLRAHLTALGCPIAGDVLYGGAREVLGIPVHRCLLHARQLVVPHPRTSAPLVLVAPFPEDLQQVLNQMK